MVKLGRLSHRSGQVPGGKLSFMASYLTVCQFPRTVPDMNNLDKVYCGRQFDRKQADSDGQRCFDRGLFMPKLVYGANSRFVLF